MGGRLKRSAKQRLDRESESNGSEDVTLAHPIGGLNDVVELAIWGVDKEIGGFGVGPVEESVDGVEERLIEDRRGNGGAAAILESGFEVGGNENRVFMKFESSTSSVNAAVNSGGMEAELNGGEAAGEVTAELEEIVCD